MDKNKLYKMAKDGRVQPVTITVLMFVEEVLERNPELVAGLTEIKMVKE